MILKTGTRIGAVAVGGPEFVGRAVAEPLGLLPVMLWLVEALATGMVLKLAVLSLLGLGVTV